MFVLWYQLFLLIIELYMLTVYSGGLIVLNEAIYGMATFESFFLIVFAALICIAGILLLLQDEE